MAQQRSQPYQPDRPRSSVANGFLYLNAAGTHYVALTHSKPLRKVTVERALVESFDAQTDGPKRSGAALYFAGLRSTDGWATRSGAGVEVALVEDPPPSPVQTLVDGIGDMNRFWHWLGVEPEWS